MKLKLSLFSVMLLLAVFLPAKAQSLRDYIRSRAESSDSLLIKALTPSLSIIRQQYRLEHNGEFFGKNNLPYYGETYSLGIKISGATILQNRVVRPWEHDAEYRRVNQSGKYTPKRFWSYQKSLIDSIYKPVEWDFGQAFTRPVDKDSLIYMNEDVISDFGLSVDFTVGQKNGYMIWAYSSSDVPDSTMHVFFRQTTFQIMVSSENTDVQMTPSEPDKIIGGLYVIPVFEPGGRIRLTLAGIASKNLENKWILHLQTSSQEENNSNSSSLQQEQEAIKKYKKAGSQSDEPTAVG